MSYLQNGGTAAFTDTIFTGTLTDIPAVDVTGAGTLALTNCTITQSATAPHADDPRNSAVLAEQASRIVLQGGTVTSAPGAIGLCAYGAGSIITGGNITIMANQAVGIEALAGGNLALSFVTIDTQGPSSTAAPAIEIGAASNFIGDAFTIEASGGIALSSMGNASLSHSTLAGGIALVAGTLALSDGTLAGTIVTGSNGGIIDPPASTLILTNETLDAGAGATLIAAEGAVSTISVVNSTLIAQAGTALYAGAYNQACAFDLNASTILGDLAGSFLHASLANASTLTGAVNGGVSLSLDATSVWNVTGASSLSELDGPGLAVLTPEGLDAGNLVVADAHDATLFTAAGTASHLSVDAGTATILSNGTDTLSFGGGAQTVFAAGATDIDAGTGTLTLVSFEQPTTLYGDAAIVDAFIGAGGGNVASGTRGLSYLAASSGNTTLSGFGQGDILQAGTSGADLLIAHASGELLIAGGGADTLIGAGADTLFGGPGQSTLYAAGNDTVVGGAGQSTIVAAAHTAIFANAGTQTVFGAANTFIAADAATLVAVLADASGQVVALGSGQSTITAGLGQDVFQATAGQAGGTALIADFANGTDIIDLRADSAGLTQQLVGNNTILTLADHTTITLLDITDLSPSSLLT